MSMTMSRAMQTIHIAALTAIAWLHAEPLRSRPLEKSITSNMTKKNDPAIKPVKSMRRFTMTLTCGPAFLVSPSNLDGLSVRMRVRYCGTRK
jgi:hypothetical protein